MRARGVRAFVLVVDVRRRAELFFQAISPHKRRGAVHLVKTLDVFRNVDKAVGRVQLLVDKVFAENVDELCACDRLKRTRMEKRRVLRLHIRFYVVPLLGHLVFRQVNLVRYFFSPWYKTS
jgi:hypothetical protein